MKLRVTKVLFDFRKYRKRRGSSPEFEGYETVEVKEQGSAGVLGFDDSLRIVEIGQFRLEHPKKRGRYIDPYPTMAKLWLGNDEDEHITEIMFVFGCFNALVNIPYFDTKKERYDFPVNNRTTVMTLLTKTKKALAKENTL